MDEEKKVVKFRSRVAPSEGAPRKQKGATFRAELAAYRERRLAAEEPLNAVNTFYWALAGFAGFAQILHQAYIDDGECIYMLGGLDEFVMILKDLDEQVSDIVEEIESHIPSGAPLSNPARAYVHELRKLTRYTEEMFNLSSLLLLKVKGMQNDGGSILRPHAEPVVQDCVRGLTRTFAIVAQRYVATGLLETAARLYPSQ